MYALKSQDQGLITLSQQDYLPILIESFLIDHRSQGLSHCRFFIRHQVTGCCTISARNFFINAGRTVRLAPIGAGSRFLPQMLNLCL
jgi:hypothetical protein